MDYTLREVLVKYKGWRKWQDNLQRESWERARLISYFAASQSLKKGVKLDDLFKNPYSFKKDKPGRQMRFKEWNRRLERWKELEYKKVR